MELNGSRSIKRWKKITAIIFLSICTLVILIIAFISPIAKYLVEKYDVKFTNREIEVDYVYVNPFTGYIHFKNLKIFEYKNDTVFISASGLSANFSMLKLFSKTYEIESVTIDEFKGKIINNRKVFNFSDLIEKFSSPKDKDTVNTKPPVHFNILDIKINNGSVYYSQPQISINYFIKNINLVSNGKRWDNDTINGKILFAAGIGSGKVDLGFIINTKNLDYDFNVMIKEFSMDIINQYLNDLSNYGSLRASLDANLKGKGNFNNEKSINAKGKIAVNKLHFGKNPNDDYVSFKKLSVDINELAPANRRYFFDSVMLEHPYFKYEKYDSLDNIQNMFGKNGSNVKEVNNNPEKFNLIIEIAKYTKEIFKDFLQSDYKINNLLVEKGDVKFNDYSSSEKFSADLTPILIKADSVDNQKRWVKLSLESGIRPYGFISVAASMDPNNNNDFDLNYKLKNLPISMFNPYIITYTSFSIDRGFIDLFGQWSVRDNIINSTNHFLAIDPRTKERIKRKDVHWIPLPLIFAFIRDKGNVIDYEIPITGNLKKPKFHTKDIIIHLIENIFVKPPTIPYRIEIKNNETEIEKSLSLTWTLRQNKLISSQEKFLKKVSSFLEKYPDANISVRPLIYTEKEKEYILFFEAKKKYYFTQSKQSQKSMTEKDSLAIEKMSIKDPAFVKYINNYTKDTMLFTIQEKCNKYIGKNVVGKKFEQLEKERKLAFVDYFKKNNTEKQTHFSTNIDTIPFNGYSIFKIEYRGVVPPSLKDAYEKLKEIDSEPPRDKYSKFRHVEK